MRKSQIEQVLREGSLDTAKYRYKSEVVNGAEQYVVIKRLPLEDLGTTAAINGWEIVYSTLERKVRKKYKDCQRADGNCTICNLVSYGNDCHNRPITNLEWKRLENNLSQQELAEKSGLHYMIIQKIELGKTKAENAKASTLSALAKALGCEIEELI